MIYPKDIFLKSPEQMRRNFTDIEQACDNTLAIAEQCNVELDLKTRHSPAFRPTDGSTPEEFLTKICCEGAKQRYENGFDVCADSFYIEFDGAEHITVVSNCHSVHL